MCSNTNSDSSNGIINGSSSSAGNGATPLADPAVGSDTWKREVEGPYRRLDANPDALELARLVFCAVTIVPIRAILIGLFLLSYYTTARCFLAVAPDRPWAHAVNIYMVRMGSWVLLWLIGCTVEVKGLRENAGRRGEPRVFVSNHISYLEILYFLAELGPSFVMKRTCLRVPFIGDIAARVLDSVSVDNKGGKEGGKGSEAIAARLQCMFGEKALATGESDATDTDTGAVASEPWGQGWRGNPLVIFPEGTTSNGSCLLRFKTGVFAGGVPVHPIVIQYDWRRFSPAFESIFFPVHALRLLAEPVTRLRVEFLPVCCPTAEHRADRTLYAKAVQQIFCKATGLPPVESMYADKTKYHTYLRDQFNAHPWGEGSGFIACPRSTHGFVEGKS